jgi:hypothetical protein
VTRFDPPPGSCYADAAAAHEALALALPMLEAARADGRVCGSGFLYLVVMDPALGPRETDFDAAVLLEHAVGDRARWDADYAAFARAKARVAWQRGRGGHEQTSLRAHALRGGDSLLAGAICLDGIVVACSGAFEPYDEAFATAVAANLRAIARLRLQRARSAGALVARR